MVDRSHLRTLGVALASLGQINESLICPLFYTNINVE